MEFGLKKLWTPLALAGAVISGTALAQDRPVSYPEPLVVYSQVSPDGPALVYARAQVDQGGEPRFVNEGECFIANAQQLKDLVTRGNVRPLLDAPVNWVHPEHWRDSALAHATPYITDMQHYESSMQNGIGAAVRDAVQLYSEFIRTVTDDEMQAALDEKLAGGADPRTLWEGNEYYPDVQSFLTGVLGDRRHELKLLQSAQAMIASGTTDFKFEVYTTPERTETKTIRLQAVYHAVTLMRRMAAQDGWENNPFYTLGFDQKYPELVKKARQYVERYDGLAEDELSLVAMRDLVDSYGPLIGGAPKPPDFEEPRGCFGVIDVRGPAPAP